MNATQAENLRVLIWHMETKCHRMLNMREVETDCGSPACALGEAKYMCDGLREQFTGWDTYTTTQNLFGLREPQDVEDFQQSWSVFRLFGASLNGKRVVSPQEWALEARKVLAENGYSMDEAKPIPSVAERLEAIYAAPLDEKPEVYAPTANDLVNAALRHINR